MKPYGNILFTLLLIYWAALPAAAQTDRALPTITLNMRNVLLEDIFKEIEKQTGMFFSYESSLLKDLPKMNFKAEDESFHYLLKRLFEKLPLVYRVTGQYIIVKQKPVQYTISGFIRDSVTFESLIHATVQENSSRKGVVSNNYGFYSITLPPGEVTISSSYVGYGRKEIRFVLQKDTLLEIQLLPDSELKEIVVKGLQHNSDVLNSHMGNIQLHSQAFGRNPVLFSEPDPVKTLHLTPGVAFGTEGLTGMYVRGGGGDENLFLIDGIPIYSANHLAGLFSTFNPDVIKHVDFYKGGFPARYGGRLSSVMDVRLKDGDMKEYHGNVNIGLISAKAHFEGPIVKDRTSLNVAFRRTWLDAITTPAFAISNRRADDKMFAGYSFYDLNTKVNHIFNRRSRMYLNFYMGQDRLRYEDKNVYASIDHPEEKDRSETDLKWRWGNLLVAGNWTYLFSNKLFGNFNVAYTRYKSKLSQWDERDYFPAENNYSSDERRNSGIEDVGYKVDFDYSPHPYHSIRFGSDYLFHVYRPEHHKQLWGNYEEKDWMEKEYLYMDDLIYGHEGSVYAEDDWRISEKVKMNGGARLSIYGVQGKAYFSFQPRLSMRYLLRNDLSVKVSYVKMNQYVHQLANTLINLPSSIWVPVTDKIKPMNSHLFSTGVYHHTKTGWDVSMEVYYKQMNNIVEFKDFSSLFPDYIRWDEKIAMGSGRSYGVEYMLRKPEGRTTGWIAYTLSWTDRQFKDKTVNGGERFPDRYDNRHKLNITANHTFSKRFDMSLAWIYASGNRASLVGDAYLSPQPDNNYSFDYYVGMDPVYKRNAISTRDYHRLDLSFNFYRPRKNGRMGIWNLSFYNLYSRMNTFYVNSAERNHNGKATIKEVGIIPVIPSFSYTYKF